MSANPVPQTPVEPPGAAAPTPHDRHLGAIAAWLGEKADEDLIVEVVTGPNRTEVARGRYVDMEAHPSAQGVYRLVFDNSKAGPDAPTGEQWVAVGHELVDVAAGDTSLIIDKGSQRIEVHLLGIAAAEPEVAAPMPTPAVAATVPPGGIAATSAEGASLVDAYAPGLEVVGLAPVQQNAALGGSRLFGETKVEIVDGEVHVTARRMRHGTAGLLMTGLVLGVLAVAGGVMLYALQALNARTSGGMTPLDVEYLDSTMKGAAAVAAVGLVLYLIGRAISAGKQPETIVALLTQVTAKAYRRFVILRGPFGRKGRRRKLVLKPAGKAEHARWDKLVAVIRAQRST